MKTLSTEQQIELQALLEEATFGDFPAETRAKLRYWVIELKPKRVRKNIMRPATENEINLQIADIHDIYG